MQHVSKVSPTRPATQTQGATNTRHSTQREIASSPSDDGVCPVCRGGHNTEYKNAEGKQRVKWCDRCASRQHVVDLQALYPLSVLLARATLDFKPMAGEERALAHARRYADAPKGWFVVQGNSGNGKSLMLAGIYHAVAAKGYNVLFLTAGTIARLYHRALDPGTDLNLSALQRLLVRVNLLCIDELDKVDWSKSFVHNEFFEMFNRRYDAMRWTAFAFNDDSAIPEAMHSRLSDGRWGDGSGDGIIRDTAADVRPHLQSLWTDPRTGERIG